MVRNTDNAFLHIGQHVTHRLEDKRTSRGSHSLVLFTSGILLKFMTISEDNGYTLSFP